MLYRIENLKKIYGDRTVLDIEILEFEESNIYALLGPNGSGKTTLLEIMSFLIAPSRGQLFYRGKKVNLSERNLTDLRREIVMVQQNPVLFTTSVYKNLDFCLKIRGLDRPHRQRAIEESLDLVGMGNFIKAEAHKLSGGETQRVAIARALVCDPKVIMFDEPTSSVDVENQITIERIIKEINRQKKISVIFTSHDLIRASKLTGNVISLFEGRRTSSIFENIFSGTIEVKNRHQAFCRLRHDIIFNIATEKRGAVKLSIDPHKIVLLEEPLRELKENLFQGKLIQLTDEREYIRAVADIGLPLNILFSKKSAHHNPLRVGNPCWIYCPRDAIRVF
jgi:tungstate transport system ATP-binding protein